MVYSDLVEFTFFFWLLASELLFLVLFQSVPADPADGETLSSQEGIRPFSSPGRGNSLVDYLEHQKLQPVVEREEAPPVVEREEAPPVVEPEEAPPVVEPEEAPPVVEREVEVNVLSLL